MAEAVCLGEENLSQVVGLATVSAAPPPSWRSPGPVTFVGDDRSSHWKARLMLAKANSPFPGRSCSRLLRASWLITLEIKDELLLDMLFFGFRRFPASFCGGGVRRVLPSPNAGALDDMKSGASLELRRPASLLLSRTSVDDWLSSGCSCMLPCTPSDREDVR